MCNAPRSAASAWLRVRVAWWMAWAVGSRSGVKGGIAGRRSIGPVTTPARRRATASRTSRRRCLAMLCAMVLVLVPVGAWRCFRRYGRARPRIFMPFRAQWCSRILATSRRRRPVFSNICLVTPLASVAFTLPALDKVEVALQFLFSVFFHFLRPLRLSFLPSHPLLEVLTSHLCSPELELSFSEIVEV